VQIKTANAPEKRLTAFIKFKDNINMAKKISKTTREVMNRIKSQEVKMRPRAYFVLGSMLLGAGIVGVLLFTIFLTGAVFFKLRMAGAMHYLGLGKPGLRFFVRSFPWKVVGLAVLSFFGGSFLLKKHSKVYKVGLGWLVLGAVVTVIGLGMLVDKAGVNERLERRRELKPLYETRFEGRDEMLRDLRKMSPPPRPRGIRPLKPVKGIRE